MMMALSFIISTFAWKNFTQALGERVHLQRGILQTKHPQPVPACKRLQCSDGKFPHGGQLPGEYQ